MFRITETADQIFIELLLDLHYAVTDEFNLFNS
jgi:hypothetical protein